MATNFDSFDRSPLGDFIQSPLLARGLQATNRKPAALETALTFSTTLTGRKYVMQTTYPQYFLLGTGPIFIRKWLDRGYTDPVTHQWVPDWQQDPDYWLSGGGDLVVSASRGTTYGLESADVRRTASPVFVTYNQDPRAYFRLRVRSWMSPVPAGYGPVIVRFGALPYEYNFDGFGSVIGTAYPGLDNYFDLGHLSGGYYGAWFQMPDDLTYGLYETPHGNTNFWAGNDGTSIRIEAYLP